MNGNIKISDIEISFQAVGSQTTFTVVCHNSKQVTPVISCSTLEFHAILTLAMLTLAMLEKPEEHLYALAEKAIPMNARNLLPVL